MSKPWKVELVAPRHLSTTPLTAPPEWRAVIFWQPERPGQTWLTLVLKDAKTRADAQLQALHRILNDDDPLLKRVRQAWWGSYGK